MKNAENGIRELAECVDTIITIPNQKLIALADDDMTMLEAFRRADDVLVQAVRGISDLIVNSGMINVDFADVKTIMAQQGSALMSMGFGRGDSRMLDAVNMAIASPLLEVSIDGARGVLFNVTGSEDLGILEVYEAAEIVSKQVDPDANIIVGAVIDPTFPAGEVKVTLIATGFDMNKPNVQRTRSFPAATSPSTPQSQPSQPRAQRPTSPPPAANPPRTQPSTSGSDDLDIPPFLRNRNRGR
jgi:cell division protein FtsZ